MPWAVLLSISNGVPVSGCGWPSSSRAARMGQACLPPDVNGAGFGFCGRTDNVFYCLTQDVEGSVGSFVVFPAEVVVDGGATACIGLDKVGGIGRHFQDHVACVVSDYAFGISVQVVHEHFRAFDSFCCRRGLFSGDFVEGWEDARVAAPSVIHECTGDGLDAFRADFVE